jgi:mannosyl-oligosaccharide glucosidase
MQLSATVVVLALVAPALSTPDTVSSNNASLLWGPYRPNLYLGIRPRMPESLIAGLMWGKFDEQEKSG